MLRKVASSPINIATVRMGFNLLQYEYICCHSLVLLLMAHATLETSLFRLILRMFTSFWLESRVTNPQHFSLDSQSPLIRTSSQNQKSVRWVLTSIVSLR